MPMKLRNGRILEKKIAKKRARLGKYPKTGWFDLPFEIREMIIDEMDTKTKFVFSRCSKLCEQEVKESKHYVYSITILFGIDQLYLQYGKEKCDDNVLRICFDQLENDKTMVFLARDNVRVLPSKSLTRIEKGSPVYVQAKYVEEYVEKYKNSIRELVFEDERSEEENVISFNVNNLKKLSDVVITSWYKDIEIATINQFIDFNKLYHMKYVHMIDTKLDFEQISKFQGEDAVLRMEHFDEQAIVQYLTMWKNEEVHENVRKREIYFDMIGNVEQIARDFEGVYNFQQMDERFSFVEYTFDCKSINNKTFHVETYPEDKSLSVEWV